MIHLILVLIIFFQTFIPINSKMMDSQNEVATFGAGCFWCVESVFQKVRGVISVTSGYAGGWTVNPTYEEVCSGATGHAEVCQIIYDKSIITYHELLEIFFSIHDPTTPNRQGNDIGTQYRSVIFYHTEEQKNEAEKYKKQLNEAAIFDKPIVTEISPYSQFYAAENYHQNYYNQNKDKPYCTFVISPKLEKFQKLFPLKVKKLNEE